MTKKTSTTNLAPGDFIASGAVHGKVESISDDGQVLVTHYTPMRGGWEASNRRANYKIQALTRIDALTPPENASTRMRVVSRAADSAELIIYADIGEGWFGGISSKEFSDQLSAIGKVKNLDVRINSGGGDVFEGITMYNRLKQHDAKVTVYVDGLAASIASIIAMAGDEIVMYESSTVMIHKPLTYVGGNSEQLQEVIARLDLVENQMLDVYVAKTGLDRKHIKDLLSAETWMTAEEAVNLGFADRVEETTYAMAAAVKPDMNKKWFAHAPAPLPVESVSPEIVRRAKAQSASLVSRS